MKKSFSVKAPQARVQGLIRVQKFRGDREVLDTGWFTNTITKNGLLHWSAVSAGMTRINASNTIQYRNRFRNGILLGEGAQNPTNFNDTNLISPIFLYGNPFTTALGVGRSPSTFFNDNPLGVSGERVGTGWPDPQSYVFSRYATEFNESSFSSNNLTEIGLITTLANGASTVRSIPAQTYLVARSLIKDSNGNPVVVTKSLEERLIVSYEIRTYPPSEWITQTPITINGEDYHVLVTPAGMQTSGPDEVFYPISAFTGGFYQTQMSRGYVEDCMVANINVSGSTVSYAPGYTSNPAVPNVLEPGNAVILDEANRTLYMNRPPVKCRMSATPTGYSVSMAGAPSGMGTLTRDTDSTAPLYTTYSASYLYFYFLDPVTYKRKDIVVPPNFRLDLDLLFGSITAL